MIKVLGFLALALTPLWICLMYYCLPLGSVGGMVPLNLAFLAIAFPAYLCWWLDDVKSDKWKLALRVLALPLGVVLAVLAINLYFPLTAWLGLDDFYWM